MAKKTSIQTSVIKVRNFSFHPLHYVLVVASAGIVFALLINVPVLDNGLRVTPFILITTAAAMFGDFGSGIFAIVVGTLAVDFMSKPTGLDLTTMTLFRSFEFLVIGTIIFLLSLRSRKLYASNIVLHAMTKKLQSITSDLQEESQGNKKQLEKLNDVNKELISLVNSFIADDEYWARKIAPHAIKKPKKHIIHAAKAGK